MPIYFKSCPRCDGDVFKGSDLYGAYLDCLQCGSMPSQLVIKSSNRKESGISIDAHIETLWVLEKIGKISAFSHDGLVKNEPLEKRLKVMTQYGYVAVESSNGNTNAPENGNYRTTPKGGKVLSDYKELVKKIREDPKLKNTEISSYELVDEDGKLTLIGKYFVQASPVIAEFIDDIYPMATLSTETPEKPQESRTVSN